MNFKTFLRRGSVGEAAAGPATQEAKDGDKPTAFVHPFGGTPAPAVPGLNSARSMSSGLESVGKKSSSPEPEDLA